MLQTVSPLALDTLNSLLQLDSVLLNVSLELLCLHGVIVVAVVSCQVARLHHQHITSSRTRCQISNGECIKDDIYRICIVQRGMVRTMQHIRFKTMIQTNNQIVNIMNRICQNHDNFKFQIRFSVHLIQAAKSIVIRKFRKIFIVFKPSGGTT